MNAEAVIQRAQILGVTLTVVEGRIRCSPKSAVSSEFIEALRQNKLEVMDYLRRDELVIEAEIIKLINCSVCGRNHWWLRHSSRWICGVCHPQPPSPNEGETSKCQ